MTEQVTSQDALECRLRLHAFDLVHSGANAGQLLADLNMAASEFQSLRDKLAHAESHVLAQEATIQQLGVCIHRLQQEIAARSALGPKFLAQIKFDELDVAPI